MHDASCPENLILLPAKNWQKAESTFGQSQQEAIFHRQLSWKEARDCKQSQQKPNMTAFVASQNLTVPVLIKLSERICCLKELSGLNTGLIPAGDRNLFN